MWLGCVVFVFVVVILTSLISFISSMAKVSWNSSILVLADVLNHFMAMILSTGLGMQWAGSRCQRVNKTEHIAFRAGCSSLCWAELGSEPRKHGRI